MKMQRSWTRLLVICVALMCYAPLQAKTQDAPIPPDAQASQNNDQDPPGRVARLNYVDGSVTFQPGGQNDWVNASINRPLASGDNLWADKNSRAEVHIGSTAIRLGENTGITLLELSDQVAQIRLVEGSLIVNVRHVDDADSYEIDTPNLAFVATQPGDYRIDVDPNAARTEVTVWRGRGEVNGGGSAYPLVAGQQATFTGSGRLDEEVGQIPGPDALDGWASDRDRNEDDADAANYVSSDMTGYEDLGNYGDWSYVAAYGYVWHPRTLVPGWAPYRYGRWVWTGSWGWTWVADEPWGFAPFHYGRWALEGNAWVWVPGPRMVHPVYAPALVGWVGGSPTFRSGVGWFPLAPGEVFVPGYHVSRAYVNRVNVTNTTVNVTRVTNVYDAIVNRSANNVTYANRSVAGGVTVVSRETFVNARPVARSVIPVSEKELAAASVSHTVELEPAKSSVMGGAATASSHPPAEVSSRAVVALRTPAAMPRTFTRTQTSASQPTLVKVQERGQPVQQTQAPVKRQTFSDEGVHSFEQTGSSEGPSPAKPQPHVWEAQGTPDSQKSRNQVTYRAGQPAARTSQSAQQGSRSVTKPAAPMQSAGKPREEEPQYSSWHSQQKPASSSTTATSTHQTTTSHTTTTQTSSTAVKK